MTTVSIAGIPAELSLQQLVELLPNSFVYSFDRQLRVLFAGGPVTADSQYTPEALVGKVLHEFMPAAPYTVAEPHLRAALAGQTSTYELTYPSGIVYQASAGPLVVSDGVVQQILVVAFNISELKQAVEAQRIAKEQLQVAIQSANVGLWDWDLRTNRVHYSTEWKRQIGYADDEISDDFAEWENRVHPDDLLRARQTAFDFAAAPWSNYGQEFRFRHKDGSYRHILAQAAVTYDVEGRPSHMYGSHIDITQSKQAEAALRESEARYHSIFEHNHSVMLLVNPNDGRIVDVNPAAAAYYGWSQEQLRQMCIFDINTATRAEIAAEMARAHQEQRYHFLFTHRLADGSLRNVEVYSGPVQFGDELLLYSVIHDITERRQAEEALRQSELALKRSQAVAHIGHWSWDTRTNTITWSEEMKRIFGLDPETVNGDLNEVNRRAIHPDDLARVNAIGASVIEHQQPVEVEYRVVWPDGSIHYVRAIPSDRVVDAQGRIVRLWGVVKDITERKLTEIEREQLLLQMRDQAEQLSQVMRSVPEGVLLLDNTGFVRLSNPRAEAMLFHLADYDDERRLASLGGIELGHLLTSPPTGQWHVLRSGSRSFEMIARPLESGPVPAGWVLVLRDVTAELAVQEQLQRQERLAAVGQLAAGIAHDFNNIISVVTIYAELLSEAPGLGEKDRARALTIIDQAMRAAGMIRQILDFSRQSVLERQVLDLLPFLKEQEKLLHRTLPENIEIELAYGPREHLILADPTRIQQLIMNLAVNARDAMPAGGTLSIELALCSFGPGAKPPLPDMHDGDWVQITVRDTGVGIAAANLAHIFEPFFTTKGPDKGTGLGLAQAHGIVAQHDGFIQVHSEVGAGATFVIWLPVHNLEGGGAARMIPATALPLPQGEGQTVLIVEDDLALRTSLVELLTILNYRVVEAGNGEEALRLLAAPDTAVDLILSDVVMPRLGGVALVNALRQRGVRTPVILMSGHPKGEEQVTLEALDVSLWVDKPPSSKGLAVALAAVLAR